MRTVIITIIIILAASSIFSIAAFGQTSSFVYQGKLQEGRIAANGTSLRYKTNVQNFTRGLDLLRSLRPITFNWINGNVPDLGFAAEEVATVEPLLATYNKSGEVKGVKHAQITTALVNAINEQQTEIEKLQAEIDGLKAVVCMTNPAAAPCRQKERK